MENNKEKMELNNAEVNETSKKDNYHKEAKWFTELLFKHGWKIIIFALIVINIFSWHNKISNNGKDYSVVTASRLEDVFKKSDLSSGETTYNGIATVYDKEDKDEVDYYVYYEATVSYGVDMKKIKVNEPKSGGKDSEGIEIMYYDIVIPELQTSAKVKIESLDYMFIDDSANTANVSKDAFNAAERDIKKECKDNVSLKKIAEENIKNTIAGLSQPILNSSDKNNQIRFKEKGE